MSAPSAAVAAQDDRTDAETAEHPTFHKTISINLNEAVGSASISPSGRDVCLASTLGLHIVDLDDPWATPRFLPHYSTIVADVQWSPHPSRAHWVISTSGTKALVFNLGGVQGSPIEHTCLGHERSITDINWAVFQCDSLATCGIDGNVLCYDLRQGGKRPTVRFCGWRFGATQVKYNRQNPNEIASSHNEYVYLWDDRKGSTPVTTIKAHDQKIYGLDWNRREKNKIVTCSLDRTVKYWTFDGSQEIETPTQTITTSSPVWRARHTPFGDGLVTLPQRSEYDVKLWARANPEKEVYKVTGHTDGVREFLWRAQGGNDASNDDREFQLITWGSDRQLLLTPIPHSITGLVGHVPHSPIEVRHLRRNAENRTYRDVSTSPSLHGSATHGQYLSTSGSHNAISNASPAAATFDLSHKLTSPMTLTNHARLPLAAAPSRYSRSANSGPHGGSASGSSLGTSPADPKGVYFPDRRSKIVARSSENLPRPQVKAFMTRGATRRPGGEDTATWMEGVRIVSDAHQDHTDEPSGEENALDGMPYRDTATTSDVRDVTPLHEELTAIVRAFQGNVRFEKISIPARMVKATLSGPWGVSGVHILLHVSMSFAKEYPDVPLTIDIERTSGTSNKVRAKLLAAVRSVASRYAAKHLNSVEACLTSLLGGKVIEPEDLNESDATSIRGTHLLIGQLSADEDEDDDDSNQQQLERDKLLANRNCPTPRRCGATFSVTGQLFIYYPVDSLTSAADKRQKSPSPSIRERKRQRRRRLFDSFGVIPSLQMQPHDGHRGETAAAEYEDDSDEVLNIPSLLMARRNKQSAAAPSESMGSLRYPALHAGVSRAYNGRIYTYHCGTIAGVDAALAAKYVIRGSVHSMIAENHKTVEQSKSPWLVKEMWRSLFNLTQSGPHREDDIPSLIYGVRLAEKRILDMLEILYLNGDILNLGMLACLLELDRRAFGKARTPVLRRAHRSPQTSLGQLDYFSSKSIRSSRSNASPHQGSHRGENVQTPSITGLAIPLKSPQNLLINASSYGTQHSSQGSSGGRGSSWALANFFKSATSQTGGPARSESGKQTPPAGTLSEQTSPVGLSPAFAKRSAIAPLTDSRKVGGIASARPNATVGRHRMHSHVSFAAEDTHSPVLNADNIREPNRKVAQSVRIVVKMGRGASSEHQQQTSSLASRGLQAQLETYRLLLANVLERLHLPLQRTQVLQLTTAATSQPWSRRLPIEAGLNNSFTVSLPLALERACSYCGGALSNSRYAVCYRCRAGGQAQPCAICHLPLNSLTETCLRCLHTYHLDCLQGWRQYEEACPAACGCVCTVLQMSTPEDE